MRAQLNVDLLTLALEPLARGVTSYLKIRRVLDNKFSGPDHRTMKPRSTPGDETAPRPQRFCGKLTNTCVLLPTPDTRDSTMAALQQPDGDIIQFESWTDTASPCDWSQAERSRKRNASIEIRSMFERPNA
jgi:hypothetical protein